MGRFSDFVAVFSAFDLFFFTFRGPDKETGPMCLSVCSNDNFLTKARYTRVSKMRPVFTRAVYRVHDP